jgi:hypothetical protein
MRGSRGYVDRGGEHPDFALTKLQPLSLRAALTEARFLEADVAGLVTARDGSVR